LELEVAISLAWLLIDWSACRACRFELRYFDPFLVLDEFSGKRRPSLASFGCFVSVAARQMEFFMVVGSS
jgi:hypothetical protein